MKKRIVLSLSVLMLAMSSDSLAMFKNYGKKETQQQVTNLDPNRNTASTSGTKSSVVPTSQALTTAEALVGAYGSDTDNLLAGAVSVAAPNLNISGVNSSSAAYRAGVAFASTGSASAPASSNKSNKLGRLSK